MINPINKILTKWNEKVNEIDYSTHSIDLNNNYHIVKLEETLDSMGFSRKFKVQLLDNIRNGRLVLGEAKFLRNIINKMKEYGLHLKVKLNHYFPRKLKN